MTKGHEGKQRTQCRNEETTGKDIMLAVRTEQELERETATRIEKIQLAMPPKQKSQETEAVQPEDIFKNK